MVTHSSILAWRIQWTVEPGGLQTRGLQSVRHHRSTNTSLFSKEVPPSCLLIPSGYILVPTSASFLTFNSQSLPTGPSGSQCAPALGLILHSQAVKPIVLCLPGSSRLFSEQKAPQITPPHEEWATEGSCGPRPCALWPFRLQ